MIYFWFQHSKANKSIMKVTYYMRKSRGNTYSIERLFSDIEGNLPADIEASFCHSRFLSQGFFKRAYDTVRAAFYQGDINHITGDVHFLTYLLTRHKTILTIHDFVSLGRLRGFKRWVLWFFWYWLPSKRCSLITVISESTRSQMLHYVGGCQDKIMVVHDCVSDEFKPVPKAFNSQRPRILQVGTNANKNLDRLAAALQGFNCELAIIGRLSAAQKDALKQNGIHYENYVNLQNDALLEQYRLCDMLVFASTYEGFGLPIIEANAVGRPVITSNVWSMPEVAGNAACLVDPFNVESIRAGIVSVIESANYRDELIANGFDNVKRFSAKRIAEQYAGLYRKLHKGGGV